MLNSGTVTTHIHSSCHYTVATTYSVVRHTYWLLGTLVVRTTLVVMHILVVRHVQVVRQVLVVRHVLVIRLLGNQMLSSKCPW